MIHRYDPPAICLTIFTVVRKMLSSALQEESPTLVLAHARIGDEGGCFAASFLVAVRS